jgi:hypothetical protein
MLIGDPMQLPPCVLSETGKLFGLSQPLFSRLYSALSSSPIEQITMLNTQYRMHPDICQFPGRRFYDGKLHTDLSVHRRIRNFTLQPLFLYNLTDSHDELDAAGSSFNIDEVKFIQKFCRRLVMHLANEPHTTEDDTTERHRDAHVQHLQSGSGRDSSNSDEQDHSSSSISSSVTQNLLNKLSSTSVLGRNFNNHARMVEMERRIAVITPYKAQIRQLRAHLPSQIEIMTADSSQGKEKEIVIVSCVRSGSTIGFLKDEHRMNVMLTRAQNALYIIGNLDLLARKDKNWQALVNDATERCIIQKVYQDKLDLPYR